MKNFWLNHPSSLCIIAANWLVCSWKWRCLIPITTFDLACLTFELTWPDLSVGSWVFIPHCSRLLCVYFCNNNYNCRNLFCHWPCVLNQYSIVVSSLEDCNLWLVYYCDFPMCCLLYFVVDPIVCWQTVVKIDFIVVLILRPLIPSLWFDCLEW